MPPASCSHKTIVLKIFTQQGPVEPEKQLHLNETSHAYLYSTCLLQERANSTLDNSDGTTNDIGIVQWTICMDRIGGDCPHA